MTLPSVDASPDVSFDARVFQRAGASERDAWVGGVAKRLNRRFFAVIRGVIDPDAPETLAAQREARDFMTAPTHAYPWSVDGARILLRALAPSSGLGASYTHLFAASEPARALFAAVAAACLTTAERERLAAGHVGGVAHPVIQTSESWKVHHGLHNDSRRSGITMPLVASFILEQGAHASHLLLWPSGQPAAKSVETRVGDLCLMRDCIEAKPGQVLYPLTHGTRAATEPAGAERVVAILRFGIVPECTVSAVSAAGLDLMDVYLKALTRG